MFNPGMIMKIQKMKNDFTSGHPKFVMFLQALGQAGLGEGTIIEVKVTKPTGETMVSNLKLNQSDVENLRDLGSMMGSAK